ncbi:MAG: hypothetical protein AAGE01_16835 [Pseudomonadota bacterium]
MRLNAFQGLLPPLATVLAGGAVLPLVGQFDYLAIVVPALLALLAVVLVLLPRAGRGGIETAMVGVVLAAASLLLATTGTPVDGPPILALPSTLAATTFVAIGVATLAIAQVPAASVVAARTRHAAALLQLIAPALGLYWVLVASARGGVAVIDLLSYGVFLVVYAPVLGAVLATAIRETLPAALLLIIPAAATAVHGLLDGHGDLFVGLVHLAAINLTGFFLALPLVALREFLAGQKAIGVVALAGGAAALVLGRGAAEALWLELRFTEQLSGGEIALWVGLPAIAVAAVIVGAEGRRKAD